MKLKVHVSSHTLIFLNVEGVTNLIRRLSKVRFDNDDKSTWNYEKITYVFGKLAGAFASRYQEDDPKLWIVEDDMPAAFGGWIKLSSFAYLEEFAKQHMKIVCLNPKNCNETDCDPYKSLLTSKSTKECKKPDQVIRRPDVKEWKSSKAFARHFLYVSFSFSSRFSFNFLFRVLTLSR